MQCRPYVPLMAVLGGILASCTSHRPPPDVARPEPARLPQSTQPTALAQGPTTPSIMPRPRLTEMRGVWISDPRGLDWGRVMSDLRGAGFNTLFLNFNTAGAAFYPSRIVPNVASRDEVQLAMDTAKKYGIQVHAKFIVWYMFRTPPAYQKRMAREKRLLLTPQGNILFQGNSTWLNPAAKINRDERLAAIREVLQNYPVAGVQLDYIRYPDNAGRITPGRLNLNTHFVADVHKEIKRLRPGIPLSVSNFYDYRRARNEMGQDWLLWAQRGYVDFLVPMNYTRDLGSLNRWLEMQRELIRGRVPIYSGLGAYLLRSSSQLNEQIALVRRTHPGGFVVFAYNDQFRQQILPGLKM